MNYDGVSYRSLFWASHIHNIFLSMIHFNITWAELAESGYELDWGSIPSNRSWNFLFITTWSILRHPVSFSVGTGNSCPKSKAATAQSLISSPPTLLHSMVLRHKGNLYPFMCMAYIIPMFSDQNFAGCHLSHVCSISCHPIFDLISLTTWDDHHKLLNT